MDTYKHRVNYYETDKMGITHHSNYPRFMEEARVYWMDKLGWSYKKCEDLGISSPVISLNCKYRKNTTFDDIIEIETKLVKYNGIRLTIRYIMKNDGDIVVIGETEHCMINKDGRIIRLKKEYPELDKILYEQLDKDKKNL